MPEGSEFHTEGAATPKPWKAKVVWTGHMGSSVMNYVNQQTLKPDDDYVLPHQRLWTFDVLVCPLLTPIPADRFDNRMNRSS